MKDRRSPRLLPRLLFMDTREFWVRFIRPFLCGACA